MTTDIEILAELVSLGSEQTRKTYARHGVGANQYGVSYAALGKLKKRLKINHPLALSLWASGNHDARILALMIADPQGADSALLDQWVRDLDNYVISDALSAYVAATPLAQVAAEQWVQSGQEWIGATGWNAMAHLALHDSALPDAYFESYLDQITRDLHASKNRVRHCMNNALIAIALRSAALEAQAIAAAQQIGKVVVDHGQTNCKTPAAIPYIQKAKARKQA